MPAEQRMHERLAVKDGALAAFSRFDGCSFCKVGDIVDISLAGLSYCYLKETEPTPESTQLEIFGYKEPRLHLQKIPCKVIYESNLRDPFGLGLGTRTIRCGLEFGDLSPKQRSQLELFIENYAASQRSG